jgi:hypothetical protein
VTAPSSASSSLTFGSSPTTTTVCIAEGRIPYAGTLDHCNASARFPPSRGARQEVGLELGPHWPPSRPSPRGLLGIRRGRPFLGHPVTINMSYPSAASSRIRSRRARSPRACASLASRSRSTGLVVKTHRRGRAEHGLLTVEAEPSHAEATFCERHAELTPAEGVPPQRGALLQSLLQPTGYNVTAGSSAD